MLYGKKPKWLSYNTTQQVPLAQYNIAWEFFLLVLTMFSFCLHRFYYFLYFDVFFVYYNFVYVWLCTTSTVNKAYNTIQYNTESLRWLELLSSICASPTVQTVNACRSVDWRFDSALLYERPWITCQNITQINDPRSMRIKGTFICGVTNASMQPGVRSYIITGLPTHLV